MPLVCLPVIMLIIAMSNPGQCTVVNTENINISVIKNHYVGVA